MSTPAQRGARAALDAARPAVARLDARRNAEDVAADLIETWSAVEAALRSLVGGSALSGQALIRDARQRQLIDFDQANALAEFHAVRDRVERTSYHASDADINAARTAFLKLDSALMGDTGMERPVGGPTVSAPVAGTAAAAAPAQATVVTRATGARGIPVWAALLIGIVAVAILGGIGYWAFARRGSAGAMDQAVADYKAGRREAAVGEFNKLARDDPKDALPHIYLARMAREVGNFPLATQELQTALQIDPSSALALREMGATMLAAGNFELARRFYVRAVQADPTDKSSQGYLGCTLMRLGRVPEAANFINRAGPGPWSSCASAASMQPGQPGAQPGMTGAPTGMYPQPGAPQPYPPRP